MTDIDTLIRDLEAAPEICRHCRGEGRYWSLTDWGWILCPNCRAKQRSAARRALKARNHATSRAAATTGICSGKR